MAQLKKLLSRGPVLAVIIIGLTAILTHGSGIPRLGYYHDDWYMLWSGASRGAGSLVSLFSTDRPFMGWIYSKVYRVIGENLLGWHWVTLLLRIAGAAAFYWILNLVWPKLKSLFVLSAMLFVVFPGFLSEPNAATKINHLIGYGSAVFSIAFTLQAAKTRHKGWKATCIGLSLIAMAGYLWIYEYMVGLEVMRISLLYWMQWQGEREKALAAAKKVALAYIPYVLVIAAFLYWRTKIFESIRPATDVRGLIADYRSDFIGMSLNAAFQVIKDFFSSAVFAWFVQPYHLLATASNTEIAGAALIAGLVVLLALGYVFAARKYGQSSENTETESESVSPGISPWVLVLIGGLIALAAVTPVVVLNRHLDLMDAYKSYALHPSAGAIILVMGIVLMLKPKFRNTVLIVLLAVSVATQSLNINEWASMWDVHRNFWWQLTWRAPAIRDDTLLMAYAPSGGYAFQQDYEVWGPVNLIYHHEQQKYPPIQSEVLNEDTVMEVINGVFSSPYVRDIYMPRNYKNLLLVSQPTVNSCIHVIDGAMPAYSASERLIVQKAGAYSLIDRIDPSAKAPVPPASIFGQEPEHGWCYYYQQASLARQTGDWRRIGDLYQAAVSAKLKPGDSSEYFVFIEGLVNLGRANEAQALADSALKENPKLKYSLCQSVTSAPAYPASFGYHLDEIKNMICSAAAE